MTDDWPDPVPVTEAEIEVFERSATCSMNSLTLTADRPMPGSKSTLKAVLKTDTATS
ncbi:hypothetical protein AB6806_21225 [Bosea sp. RCC_152_1]|uniref:hypothetical protein n=1 Tax=Bosea sp. RCC_152_1 TaxID=3239228 RepID=UPI0035239805